MPSDERTAMRRFWILQGLRLAGLGLALAGAMAIAGTLNLNQAQGAVLLIGGAVAFFFLPVLMAKHWKAKG
ncbi:hypothetical protein E3U23_02130 [Erythrobacter litoralis]|uniref:hypothetical protein n=1 Tax=Erythrobacter litoralis TaxID=39960 RepID=UPI0024351FC5|nr:hypothetical protein [Erythrobacter litoralis]MDG6077996.1 hypothetical protein [Erythrobacter litoralis]